jgi:beta-mannosidase
MSIEILSLDGQWKLRKLDFSKDYFETAPSVCSSAEAWMDVQVPGDIHPSLVKAGHIPDPFVDLNSRQCAWTREKSWSFKRQFVVPETYTGKRIMLVFDGIDTYATIFVNGQKIGQSDNAFLQYRFDVTAAVRIGQVNDVEVCIHAIKQMLSERDCGHYFACFNTERIFARKPQCQFSWDWAPDMPAIGIWQDVRLEAVDTGVIKDVYVRTELDGRVHFQITLDKQSKERIKQGDRFELETTVYSPNGDTVKTIKAMGQKNFINLSIPNPRLWWPNGYGQPNLYAYRVRLLDGLRVLHEKQGRFGIRKIELIEEAVADNLHGFRFRVNGIDVFCMGSNWIPADCFPGMIGPERYQHLLELARDANLNMLRVWGGGMYEKDIFYDLCDEYGIMVWQDLMFACSDIPDDDTAWTLRLVPEFEYQVRRLRNHPCLTHWCGGNEKTGTYGEMKSYGDLVTNYLARGVIQHLMPGASYTPSSPYSLTDVGNEPQSGDTHGGTWEKAFIDGIRNFRQHIDTKKTVFMSEFGFHGPPEYRNVKKFISEDMLWPLNGAWEHHIMDNPYNDIKETYVQVQLTAASQLFYPPQNAADFVKVAGTLYAEYIYAEFQHHRRRFPLNAGALTWMFNDCWPAASWSMVDYYGYPKQVYYAVKRAARPVMISFRDGGELYEVYVTCNCTTRLQGRLTLAMQTVDGSTSALAAGVNVAMAAQDSKCFFTLPKKEIPEIQNSYLIAELSLENQVIQEVFFHNLWADILWPQPELTVSFGKARKLGRDHLLEVALKSKTYARCVHLTCLDEARLSMSDNYFDMPAGTEKSVTIRSCEAIEPSRLKVKTWLDIWT